MTTYFLRNHIPLLTSPLCIKKNKDQIIFNSVQYNKIKYLLKPTNTLKVSKFTNPFYFIFFTYFFYTPFSTQARIAMASLGYPQDRVSLFPFSFAVWGLERSTLPSWLLKGVLNLVCAGVLLVCEVEYGMHSTPHHLCVGVDEWGWLLSWRGWGWYLWQCRVAHGEAK